MARTKKFIIVIVLFFLIFNLLYAFFQSKNFVDLSSTSKESVNKTPSDNSSMYTQVDILSEELFFTPIPQPQEQPLVFFTPSVESSTQSQNTQCVVRGCANEICMDASADYNPPSKCELKPEYTCLQPTFATCQLQPNNKCGWTYKANHPICMENIKYDTDTVKVIEVRYFPNGPGASTYHPDTLSAQLRNFLKDASSPKKYANANRKNFIEVDVVDVINVNSVRPQNDFWFEAYEQILEDFSLCDRIVNEEIDQIWLWVDPRPGYDPNGKGLEYAISSKHIMGSSGTGTAFGGRPPEPFCGGLRSFVVMGFDMSRTFDYAVHSYGHFLESLVINFQTFDLFWYRFAGGTIFPYYRSQRCGDVHFPPNAQIDYEYATSALSVNTFCEDWNPNGTGVTKLTNCTAWGCSQEGYLRWWMQNFPFKETLIYNSKIIPPWWDLVDNIDQKVNHYYNSTQFHFNRDLIDESASLDPSICNCQNGADQFGNPVNTTVCGFTLIGADLNCYRCFYSGWSVVGQSQCNP